MLRDVRQQPDDRRREPPAADLTRVAQRRGIDRTYHLLGPIEGAI
jgi:hypothetical protein